MSTSLREMRYRSQLGEPRNWMEFSCQWCWRWRKEIVLAYIAIALTIGIILNVDFHT